MARIRSIHPEQWTDENFAALSYPARLLAIGIRNLCDDKGVFEWKPVGIKMKLFPADNLDMEPLLAELAANDQCVRFECGGKSYGAVRNFRLFQRPQKPNDLYPLPGSLREYVGLSRHAIPDDYDTGRVPVSDACDSDTGIAIQMEDVGEGEEKEEKYKKRAQARAAPRKRGNPKISIPPDAVLSPEMRAIAATLTDAEANAQFIRFRDTAIANGRCYANWTAAWRNWLTSPHFRPLTGTVTHLPNRRLTDAEQLDAHLDDLKAQLAVRRLE